MASVLLSYNDIYSNKVEVIPSVKDLKFDLYNIEKKKDWIYDEATAPVLLFLYGMIKHKFDGNPDLLFNLMGKPGTSLNKTTHNRSLTIGSLDIGGGTTDLMICKYDYNYNEITELIPDPLYWESFNLAGDDLLKEVIKIGKKEKDLTHAEKKELLKERKWHLEKIKLEEEFCERVN